MTKRAAGTFLLICASMAGLTLWRTKAVHGAVLPPASTESGTAAGWSRQAAAHYLDDREIWWQAWKPAQKDHDTKCISCHTVVPYALVRPTLRRDLGETAPTPTEKVMLDSVEKRVTHWSEMVPFYNDVKSGTGKTVESHATEAVLNAIMLTAYDTAQGQLRPVTRTAFDNAWALQETAGENAGGWRWQDFHLGPWEGDESAYQGAALLMLEALQAPGVLAKEPAMRAHLALVRAYLKRKYAAQPRINQIYVLWAAGKNHQLLDASQRKALLAAIRQEQQPDGGWRTTTLDRRPRVDHTPEPLESDGYATGVTVLALEVTERSSRDEMLRKGLAWLSEHQQKDGTWTALSINKKRDPQSPAGPFMTDAATAYAALALERQR